MVFVCGRMLVLDHNKWLSLWQSSCGANTITVAASAGFLRRWSQIVAKFSWNGRWLVGADLSFHHFKTRQDSLLDHMSSLANNLFHLNLFLCLLFLVFNFDETSQICTLNYFVILEVLDRAYLWLGSTESCSRQSCVLIHSPDGAGPSYWWVL